MNQITTQRSDLFIISLLGVLSIITPFSIDMYLPAFPQAAQDFSVSPTVISLTISSYFIGLALGQIFYGPLLDRFGRKKPLYAGLGLFVLASVGCAMAPDIDRLIALRFIQALGGCVAQVAALAMVRDFFKAEECAVIITRLFLFIAVSPLFAPSIGGMITLVMGWRTVFFLLAIVAMVVLALICFMLPESHTPDKTISLKPVPIINEYIAILKNPRFVTYAFAGAFSFAGLFTYVAGSPVVFMEGFHLSAKVYSGIFALLATGFIGASQFNAWLLKKMDSETLFFRCIWVQSVSGLIFILGSAFGWYGLFSTLALFFVFLSCAGLTYPNAAAIALTPFTKNAGSASALLGFIQLGVGAVISSGIGASASKDAFPVIAIMGVTAFLGLCIMLVGRKRAHESTENSL